MRKKSFKDYSVESVKAGRVKKICSECNKEIDIGEPAFTISLKYPTAHYTGYVCSDKCLYSFEIPFRKMKNKLNETYVNKKGGHF